MWYVYLHTQTHTHTTKCNSDRKKKEFLQFATTQMGLEGIALSAISQTDDHAYVAVWMKGEFGGEWV